MAISVKELGRKAENLIEQGKEADNRVQICQSRVAQARNQVAAAQRQLDLASETDEDGNPKGDVGAAYARLNVARNQLHASENALSEAQGNAERIKGEKSSHASKIESYNAVEKSNLEKLKALRNKAFSGNANALSEGIASRMNEAERARIELLQSMGLSATPEFVHSGAGGSTGSPWGGISTPSFDTGGTSSSAHDGRAFGNGPVAAPAGGGLSNISSDNFENSNTNGGPKGQTVDENKIQQAQQYSLEWLNELTLSEKAAIVDYSRAIPNYHKNINNVHRGKEASFEPGNEERSDNIHNALQKAFLPTDMIVYRRGGEEILGALRGKGDSELVGAAFRDRGFISTSMRPEKTLAGDTMLEIHIPKGCHAVNIETLSLSGSHEEEVLIDRDKVFVITGVREGLPVRTVVVEMLSI